MQAPPPPFLHFFKKPLSLFPIFCYNFYIKWNKEAIYTEKVTVFMPAYVRDFRCKCGDCRAVCCHGWRIRLTEAEYRRITALPVSPGLSEAMRHSFALFDEPTADAYAYISHGADGKCPMLDGGGLCALQKECGAAVQPAVCRLYPRSVRAGDPTEIVCADSCEATVEMLMAADTPLPFVTIEGEIAGGVPPYEPAHEEERALQKLCIEILQNSGIPLGERIGQIGALLGVTDAPESEADLLTRARALLLAFGREGSTIAPLAAAALRAFSLSESVTAQSVSQFTAASARFTARFPKVDGWLENLLVNHLFFIRFPRRDLSHAHQFFAFRSAYTLLLVLAVCHTDEIGTEESFADVAAAAFHCIEHSIFYEIAPRVERKEVGGKR